MNGFTYENQGTETMLVYRLGEEEHLDSFAKGMLQSNDIVGILHPAFTQRDAEQYLKFPVTSRIPLREFIQREMEKGTVLNLILTMAGAVQEVEEYMLSPEKILLDPDYIFVNIRKKEASFLYLPIDEFVQEVSVKEFLLYMLSHMRYELSQDVSYVAKLIHFFNKKTAWTIEELKQYIKELESERETVPVQKADKGEHQERPAASNPVIPPRNMEPLPKPHESSQNKNYDVRKPEIPPAKAPVPAVQTRQEDKKKNGLFSFGKKKEKTSGPITPKPEAPRRQTSPLSPSGIPVPGQQTPPLPPAGMAIPGQQTSPVPPSGMAIPGRQTSPVPPSGMAIPGRQTSPVPPSGMAIPGRQTSPVPLSGMAIPGQQTSPVPSSGMAVPGQQTPVSTPAPATPVQQIPPEIPRFGKRASQSGKWHFGKSKKEEPVRSNSPAIPHVSPDSFGQEAAAAYEPAPSPSSYQQMTPPPFQNPEKQKMEETFYMTHGSSDDESSTVIMGGGIEYGSTMILGAAGNGEPVSTRVVKITRRRTGQSMVINKSLFRIGSEASFVDFFIGDNPSIGSCHAEIAENNGVYSVIDKNSLNRTYVNGIMAQPMSPVQIVSGSILTLADEDFDFMIC